MNEHLDGSSSDHQSQLDEIRQATGKSYRWVQGIPTEDPKIAREVLPLLAARLSQVPLPANRASIYTRFCTQECPAVF